MIYVIVMLVNLIYGTIFSSFYNVVSYRVPQGKSVVRPGSHCGNCNHKLGLKDLVPVFSCLSTKGKCRYCKTSFGIGHAIMEFYIGVLFAIASLMIFENIFIYISLLLLISFYNLNRVSMSLYNKFLIKISLVIIILILLLLLLTNQINLILYLFVFLLIYVFVSTRKSNKFKVKYEDILISISIILSLILL